MLSVLFTINLLLICVVATYHMLTRSENSLIYFLSYGYGLSSVSIIQIVGYTDIALKLSVLTIAIFVCAVLFKICMLIKESLESKQHGTNFTR